MLRCHWRSHEFVTYFDDIGRLPSVSFPRRLFDLTLRNELSIELPLTYKLTGNLVVLAVSSHSTHTTPTAWRMPADNMVIASTGEVDQISHCGSLSPHLESFAETCAFAEVARALEAL